MLLSLKLSLGCDGREVKALVFKPKVSHLQELDPRVDHTHVRKGFFLAVGPYLLLALCQYNVTEWCVMLICDIVHQCASTLKVAISAH